MTPQAPAGVLRLSFQVKNLQTSCGTGRGGSVGVGRSAHNSRGGNGVEGGGGLGAVTYRPPDMQHAQRSRAEAAKLHGAEWVKEVGQR